MTSRSTPPETPPTLDAVLDKDTRLALLLDELTEQVRRGEKAEIHAAIAAHPDLAYELRELWAAVLVADVAAAGSRSRQTSGETAADARSLATSATDDIPRFGDYELLAELG